MRRGSQKSCRGSLRDESKKALLAQLIDESSPDVDYSLQPQHKLTAICCRITIHVAVNTAFTEIEGQLRLQPRFLMHALFFVLFFLMHALRNTSQPKRIEHVPNAFLYLMYE